MRPTLPLLQLPSRPGLHVPHQASVQPRPLTHTTTSSRTVALPWPWCRRDRRYIYKAVPQLGGWAFENGQAVKDWLNFVTGGATPGMQTRGGTIQLPPSAAAPPHVASGRGGASAAAQAPDAAAAAPAPPAPRAPPLKRQHSQVLHPEDFPPGTFPAASSLAPPFKQPRVAAAAASSFPSAFSGVPLAMPPPLQAPPLPHGAVVLSHYHPGAAATPIAAGGYGQLPLVGRVPSASSSLTAATHVTTSQGLLGGAHHHPGSFMLLSAPSASTATAHLPATSSATVATLEQAASTALPAAALAAALHATYILHQVPDGTIIALPRPAALHPALTAAAAAAQATTASALPAGSGLGPAASAPISAVQQQAAPAAAATAPPRTPPRAQQPDQAVAAAATWRAEHDSPTATVGSGRAAVPSAQPPGSPAPAPRERQASESGGTTAPSAPPATTTTTSGAGGVATQQQVQPHLPAALSVKDFTRLSAAPASTAAAARAEPAPAPQPSTAAGKLPAQESDAAPAPAATTSHVSASSNTTAVGEQQQKPQAQAEAADSGNGSAASAQVLATTHSSGAQPPAQGAHASPFHLPATAAAAAAADAAETPRPAQPRLSTSGAALAAAAPAATLVPTTSHDVVKAFEGAGPLLDFVCLAPDVATLARINMWAGRLARAGAALLAAGEGEGEAAREVRLVLRALREERVTLRLLEATQVRFTKCARDSPGWVAGDATPAFVQCGGEQMVAVLLRLCVRRQVAGAVSAVCTCAHAELAAQAAHLLASWRQLAQAALQRATEALEPLCAALPAAAPAQAPALPAEQQQHQASLIEAAEADTAAGLLLLAA